jgi:phage replication-related protein YjqB (UPF0714/DUF867 family)
MDIYRNFASLCRREVKGRDYDVHSIVRNPLGVVMAPHGGRIERFTAEVAYQIAGDLFSWYAFIGIRPRGNRRLHITSHRFDEPTALDVVAGARVVLAVHGLQQNAAIAMVGGRDAACSRQVAAALSVAGFAVRPPVSGIGGMHPRNICNRGRTGRGVQLELGAGLRRELMASRRRMARFARTVRGVLAASLDTVG